MKDELKHLEGTIERIVFYSPDTGYTVCKFSLPDGQSITIVGAFPPLSPGEFLRIKGEWEVNPKFGKQFKVESFLPVLPSSAKGIEKFLASGLIKGVGPVLAKEIILKFGEKTIDILSKNPDKIKEVAGIGPVKLREVKKSWAEHEDIRELIIFLQEHSISTTLATKIYKHYGDRSFHILRSNPYQACHDIWGIGFKTADQMALKLGLEPNSPERIKAYIRYLLEKDIEQGHVFSMEKDIKKDCMKELEIERDEDFDQALKSLKQSRLVRSEQVNSDSAVYLPFYYEAQQEVVKNIHKLSKFPFHTPPFDVEEAIADVEHGLGLRFSVAQRLAVKESFQKKILVITGGPGTGKTTIVKAVVDIFHKWGQKVLLAAPTGRAAKRLSEATGKHAKTIHRTLEFNPKAGTFRRGEKHQLVGDALIIDEFSMVDLPLMYYLLKAVPEWMRLILVGDKDQLPSVGPGCLLRDIIESERVEVVTLKEIFRQEMDSLIVQNAHRINQGKSLIYPPKGSTEADFFFVHQENDQKAFSTIMKLCGFSVPRKLGVKALSPHIQVISPMYRGVVGVDNLNTELQSRLNKYSEGLKLGTREIRIHDKVMQIKNNYEKEIFNGDIGVVADIDKREYRLYVDFDGRIIKYDREEMNELTLAYAISVHKSQGSEYQAVVMPLMTQHFIMLQRNLFYTALTRAKKLCVIVGSYKALHIAIKNDKPVKRNCLVRDKLIQIHETQDAWDIKSKKK
ncbi:MAG: ATP-dependent RecD-like DNA helicase [Candidatus Aminicenantes bacterium]|nr:ATP-dependent RecD-like DNA helicase [Candidatus Aminicenantes bacterium]